MRNSESHNEPGAVPPDSIIPGELRARRQWVAYKLEQRKGEDKPTKVPYRATNVRASTTDGSTWLSYEEALALARQGEFGGVGFVFSADDPFTGIDLDHCRCTITNSIDVWAQNYLQEAVNTYQEVTPSGEGVRIWGFTDGNPLNRKFTLKIEGKDIAAELFRRTSKALAVTGDTLDPAIREFSNIDRVFDWAVLWGERRKAAAAAEQAPCEGNGFDSTGCKYSIDDIEHIVRHGPPAGANRSDVFHAVVGHYVAADGRSTASSNIYRNTHRVLAAAISLKTVSAARSNAAPRSLPRRSCRCSMAGKPGRRRSRSPRSRRSPSRLIPISKTMISATMISMMMSSRTSRIPTCRDYTHMEIPIRGRSKRGS